jgi:hypothetical protein
MFSVNEAPPPKTAQFSTNTMNINEGSGGVTVTVTRSGDLSNEVTIDYQTVDGTATERNDYTTAIGMLRFAPGESQKIITVLITEDSKTEGPESATIVLSNPTGGMALGNPSVLTLDIADDAVEPPTNANDESASFVRQHYHDFLNREADPSGLAFWTNEIESCGANVQCREVKRINVSAAFFLSIEFQETGYFVYRFYKDCRRRRLQPPGIQPRIRAHAVHRLPEEEPGRISRYEPGWIQFLAQQAQRLQR